VAMVRHSRRKEQLERKLLPSCCLVMVPKDERAVGG
jgi:hypothetical protein